jgi:hypothetical protein
MTNLKTHTGSDFLHSLWRGAVISSQKAYCKQHERIIPVFTFMKWGEDIFSHPTHPVWRKRLHLCRMETWRAIPGYTGKYEVSNLGSVRTIRNGRMLKQRVDRAGYMSVRLSSNGNTHTFFVHRLVAESFIPRSPYHPVVNHLNGNKTDNRSENLEWTTHKGNMQHAYLTGLCNAVGKVVVDDCTGQKYLTIKEAALSLGMNPGTCRNYLNGNIKANPTSLRYAWKIGLFITVGEELKKNWDFSDRRKVIWYV